MTFCISAWFIYILVWLFVCEILTLDKFGNIFVWRHVKINKIIFYEDDPLICWYECPKCNEDILGESKYCSNCGRKISWFYSEKGYEYNYDRHQWEKIPTKGKMMKYIILPWFGVWWEKGGYLFVRRRINWKGRWTPFCKVYFRKTYEKLYYKSSR